MDNEPLTFRPMETGDEAEARQLAIRVFKDLVAPGFSQEGVAEYLAYLRPAALVERSHEGHVVLLATVRDRIVGMIEIRNYSHVSLLFVDRPFQRQGTARELLRRALGLCRAHLPELREVTVHAAPDSVHIYERLGFQPTDGEQTVNGIRFTPVRLELS
jgi:GNAT superfamily N-acetyltransferase